MSHPMLCWALTTHSNLCLLALIHTVSQHKLTISLRMAHLMQLHSHIMCSCIRRVLCNCFQCIVLNDWGIPLCTVRATANACMNTTGFCTPWLCVHNPYIILKFSYFVIYVHHYTHLNNIGSLSLEWYRWRQSSYEKVVIPCIKSVGACSWAKGVEICQG